MFVLVQDAAESVAPSDGEVRVNIAIL